MCSQELMFEHIGLLALILVLILVNLLMWREISKLTK